MGLNGKYSVGEPVGYTSVYGYQKRKFPVFGEDQSAGAIGYIKEEIILGDDGKEVAKTYYTRSSWRNHGQLRFFESPEALIIGYGGKIDRTKKKPTAKKPRAKAKPAARIKKAA